MEQGGSGAQALHDAALALEATGAKLRLKRVVSVHVGELGESLRQLVRLGLGEAVVGWWSRGSSYQCWGRSGA